MALLGGRFPALTAARRDFSLGGARLLMRAATITCALLAGCSMQPERTPSSGVVLASWYGPQFAGRRTADGETFNQYGLTAASKDLPMGSRLRVTNLRNGRSVVVRINDRGPYVRGRSLDLSKGAAQRIGLEHQGVGAVRVTRLDHTSSRRHWTSRRVVRHRRRRLVRHRRRRHVRRLLVRAAPAPNLVSAPSPASAGDLHSL